VCVWPRENAIALHKSWSEAITEVKALMREHGFLEQVTQQGGAGAPSYYGK